MKKWATFGAVLAAIGAMIGWALSDDRLSNEEQVAMATTDFYQSLPAEGCVTRAEIVAAATARDWAHGPRDDFNFCIAPDGLTDWYWVERQPPLLMSTEDENRLYFGFDPQGCSVDWTYAACD
ncbi:hypothetical protein [Yoonia sp. 208BN28-4]|uniref:hypothetical protein n=1 Tax=Yoonia sp. 208BN28-4 TaxID=3126505 RepID=UPI00309DA4B1